MTTQRISQPPAAIESLKKKAHGPQGALKKALNDHGKEEAKVVGKRLDLSALNVKQWNGSIQAEHAAALLEQIEEAVLPWLRASEKLQVHTQMQAQAITLLQRKGDADDTVAKLTRRVASVIALKEDVDDFMSQECERILGIIESQHEKATDADK